MYIHMYLHIYIIRTFAPCRISCAYDARDIERQSCSARAEWFDSGGHRQANHAERNYREHIPLLYSWFYYGILTDQFAGLRILYLIDEQLVCRFACTRSGTTPQILEKLILGSDCLLEGTVD